MPHLDMKACQRFIMISPAPVVVGVKVPDHDKRRASVVSI